MQFQRIVENNRLPKPIYPWQNGFHPSSHPQLPEIRPQKSNPFSFLAKIFPSTLSFPHKILQRSRPRSQTLPYSSRKIRLSLSLFRKTCTPHTDPNLHPSAHCVPTRPRICIPLYTRRRSLYLSAELGVVSTPSPYRYTTLLTQMYRKMTGEGKGIVICRYALFYAQYAFSCAFRCLYTWNQPLLPRARARQLVAGNREKWGCAGTYKRVCVWIEAHCQARLSG